MSKVLAKMIAHAMLDPEGFVESREVPSSDTLARLLAEATLRNEAKALAKLSERVAPPQTMWSKDAEA